MRVALALLVTLVLVSSCAPSGVTLSVDVLTDLVPGPEFDQVDVLLLPAGSSRTMGSEVLRTAIRPAAFADAGGFRRGLRAADFPAIAEGAYTVRVRLLRPPRGTGTVLVEKWSSIVVRGSTRVTVGLDAACVAVSCPAPGGSAAFTECARGQCVDPFCDPADSSTWAEHCCDPMDPLANCDAGRVLFCAAASECEAPTSPCATASCQRGLCLQEPRDAACGAGEYCAREEGCRALPMMAAGDAGMLDVGMHDAGPTSVDARGFCQQVICEDPSDPCFLHYIDCVTGACVRLTTREVGAACPTGVCSNDQRCITCPGAPLCDPMSDVDGDGIVDRRDIESCDGIDNDGDGVIDDGVALVMSYFDRDGDTYGDPATLAERCSSEPGTVLRGGDCDDTDVGFSPDVAEVCNGLDEDCDGAADSGLVFLDYFADNDGDGVGSTASGMRLCAMPPGSVLVDGDCDDANPLRAPGLVELCNGVDDDCVGGVDDGLVFTDYFADVDRDGVGNTATLMNLCARPAGSVLVGGDCDDMNALRAPDRAEVCNGIDDNCVAGIDEGLFVTQYRDVDGDGFGLATMSRLGCAGSAGWASAPGDCDDTRRAVSPSALEVCNGLDDDCNGSVDVRPGICHPSATCTGVTGCICVPPLVGDGVSCGTALFSSVDNFLKASNAESGDTFGYGLALSADGSTLAVGAPRESSSGTGVDGVSNNAARSSGAVYVFARSGASWAFQAYVKPIGNTSPSDGFGLFMALSADGSTLVVGAGGEDSSGLGVGTIPNEARAESGAVYVYTRTGSTWAPEAFIKASNAGTFDSFGSSVSLSADGNTLAVGAPGEDTSNAGVNPVTNEALSSSGAVYVFTRAASVWTQTAIIKATNPGLDDGFGRTLAVSGDGNTLAVGTTTEDSSGAGVNPTPDELLRDSGAVYVYTRAASAWSFQAFIKATNPGTADAFSNSLALSNDGSSLAVAAPSEASSGAGVGSIPNEALAYAGAVYIYRRTGAMWAPEAFVKASNPGSSDSFGSALALSPDGDTLAVGAPGEASSGTGVGSTPNELASPSGAVYVYTRAGAAWSFDSFVKANNTGVGDSFGYAVGLDQRTRLVVGAPGESSAGTGIGPAQDEGSSSSGAVYVYR